MSRHFTNPLGQFLSSLKWIAGDQNFRRSGVPSCLRFEMELIKLAAEFYNRWYASCYTTNTTKQHVDKIVDYFPPKVSIESSINFFEYGLGVATAAYNREIFEPLVKLRLKNNQC